MVRFTRDELFMLLNALEAYGGDYEDENHEDHYCYTESKKIYNKIEKEIKSRDMKKKKKELN